MKDTYVDLEKAIEKKRKRMGQQQKKDKRRYYNAKKKGICVKCRERKAFEDYVLCRECLKEA